MVPDAQLFNAEWRAAVLKNTERFYGALLPSMEQLMNPELQGVATIERTTLLYGRMGSGKSAKTRTIIEKVRQFYGTKNVAVHEVMGEGFRAVLDAEKWPRRLIQVVAVHDCGRVKFSDADLRDFWRMRHIMAEKTGLSRGLVLLIFDSHSYFELPTVFRSDTDMILMSDLPTNPFHKQQYKTFFIPEEADQERLRQFARERLNNPKFCGYAYMLDHGEPAGFIYLPQVAVQEKRGLHLPSIQVNAPEGRDLLVPLAGAVLSFLTLYSLAQSNFTGASFWGILALVIGVSWMLTRRRRS